MPEKKSMEPQMVGKPTNTQIPHKIVAGQRRFYCFFQPQVLVIDDKPDPLLKSIQTWLEHQYNFRPMFDVVSEAASFSEIEKRLPTSDFVLLDHRTEGKFVGFSSGVEIGLSIKERSRDIPIAYYTGYPADLNKQQVRDDVKRLTGMSGVTSYEKSALIPSHRSLTELCLDIVTAQPIRAEMHGAQENEILAALYGAQIEKVSRFLYRIENFDRRRARQTLRCFSDLEMGEIEVPTSHLIKADITEKEHDIWLKVVNLDGGQVISYLSRANFMLSDVPSEILMLLDD